jgi:hypothetical protein
MLGTTSTPLIFIVEENGNPALARMFIEENLVEINTPNEHGMTALMVAAQKNRLELLQLLLEKGADYKLTNNDHKSALMLAAENGHELATKALVAAGAKLSARERILLGRLLFKSPHKKLLLRTAIAAGLEPNIIQKANYHRMRAPHAAIFYAKQEIDAFFTRLNIDTTGGGEEESLIDLTIPTEIAHRGIAADLTERFIENVINSEIEGTFNTSDYAHPMCLTGKHLFNNSAFRSLLVKPEQWAIGNYGRQASYVHQIISKRTAGEAATTTDIPTAQELLSRLPRIRIIYRTDHNLSSTTAMLKITERLRFLDYTGPIDILYYDTIMDTPGQKTNKEKLAHIFPTPIPNITFIAINQETLSPIQSTESFLPHLNRHSYKTLAEIPYAPLSISFAATSPLAHPYFSLLYTGTFIDLSVHNICLDWFYQIGAITLANGEIVPLLPKQLDPLSYVPSELTPLYSIPTSREYTWADYLRQSDLPYDSMVVRAVVANCTATESKMVFARLLKSLLTKTKPVLIFNSGAGEDYARISAWTDLLTTEVKLFTDPNVRPTADFVLPEGIKVAIIQLPTLSSEIFEQVVTATTLPFVGMGSLVPWMRLGKITLIARDLELYPEDPANIYKTITGEHAEFAKNIAAASTALAKIDGDTRTLDDLLIHFDQTSAPVRTVAMLIKEKYASTPDQLTVALTWLGHHYAEAILDEEHYKSAACEFYRQIQKQDKYATRRKDFTLKLELLGAETTATNFDFCYDHAETDTILKAINKNPLDLFYFLLYFKPETQVGIGIFHRLLYSKIKKIAHLQLTSKEKIFLLLFLREHLMNVSREPFWDANDFLILGLMFLLDKTLFFKNPLLDTVFIQGCANTSINPFYGLMLRKLLCDYNHKAFERLFPFNPTPRAMLSTLPEEGSIPFLYESITRLSASAAMPAACVYTAEQVKIEAQHFYAANPLICMKLPELITEDATTRIQPHLTMIKLINALAYRFNVGIILSSESYQSRIYFNITARTLIHLAADEETGHKIFTKHSATSAEARGIYALPITRSFTRTPPLMDRHELHTFSGKKAGR